MEMRHLLTCPALRTARALLPRGERGRDRRSGVITRSRDRFREQRLLRFAWECGRRYLIAVTVQ